MKDDHKEFIWFVLAVAAAVLLCLFLRITIIPADEGDAEDQGRPAIVLSVINGDTVVVGVITKVSLANVDVPDTYQPQCPKEYEIGMGATTLARMIMPKGSVVILRYMKEGKDKYTLANVFTVDNIDVGEILVDHGLAKYKSKQHNWCEDLKKEKPYRGEEKEYGSTRRSRQNYLSSKWRKP